MENNKFFDIRIKIRLILSLPPSPPVSANTMMVTLTHQATHSIVVEAIHFDGIESGAASKNCFINYASNFEYFRRAYDALF
jgi:hypothetical protein